MLRISDSNAMRLERLVRRVYGCERFGVGHMDALKSIGNQSKHLLTSMKKHFNSQTLKSMMTRL